MNLDFLKGKKVLITGGAGLLGTSLTQHLVTNGVLTKSTYFSRESLGAKTRALGQKNRSATLVCETKNRSAPKRAHLVKTIARPR